MLTMNDFKVGDTLFHLDRNYPSNNSRVVEMTVRENPETSELQVHGKQGYFTIKYDITQDILFRLNSSSKPLLFKTKKEAVMQYDSEIDKEVNDLMNTPKYQILKQLYNGWSGDHQLDYRIYEAMREKIHQEFGIRVV